MACLMLSCATRRDELMATRYPGYSAEIRHAIDRGYPINGMDQEQAYLALGEPICRKTIEREGRPVDVWIYPPGGRDPCRTGEFRIYFEEGRVSHWDRFDAAPRFSEPRTP